MRDDPVTPELRDAVLIRDGFRCVALGLDPDHRCQDKWGRPLAVRPNGRMHPAHLTLDHVKDQPMMGKRAPSDMAHLVTLCWGAHLWTGWATSHRPQLREYIARQRQPEWRPSPRGA
jgi:hypothetical protein